jgi:hypothetical protein
VVGIEPVVDPISPMLHQLRARADQRERSVLLVETFQRNALQRRCEIDPLSGTSCTSVDDYHMSLPRVELDNVNQPDDR